MNPIKPKTGNFGLPDAKALESLQNYRTGLLKETQARAEKWIAGLVAVTGILTTAVVIKGPETFTKHTADTQLLIVILMAVGFVLLVAGTLLAYAAAFGNPFGKDKLYDAANEQNPSKAWEVWSSTTTNLALGARKWLKWAAAATVIGTLVLGAAVLTTWLTPLPTPAVESSTCVQIADGVALVIPCPK